MGQAVASPCLVRQLFLGFIACSRHRRPKSTGLFECQCELVNDPNLRRSFSFFGYPECAAGLPSRTNGQSTLRAPELHIASDLNAGEEALAGEKPVLQSRFNHVLNRLS